MDRESMRLAYCISTVCFNNSILVVKGAMMAVGTIYKDIIAFSVRLPKLIALGIHCLLSFHLLSISFFVKDVI